MTKPAASTEPPASSKRALVLAPELPGLGKGGGPLRTESLVQYLRQHYEVDIVTFDLPVHSKSTVARVWRNTRRLVAGQPPLFDRYSGHEVQLTETLSGKRYEVAVIEHFWCASYAPLLRKHSDHLVLDLHNIESELARTHAASLSGPAALASNKFAAMYETLEKQLLPSFDTLLVTSENDHDRARQLSHHKDIRIFPNALPDLPIPTRVTERESIVFSGNLEYHPNVEAIRWFRTAIWPQLRDLHPHITWTLLGRNDQAIRSLIQGDDRILVTGPVDDAIASLAQSKVCIVPLRSGSGTRFKILEAWAAQRAVVSTSLGAEGLTAIDGKHLLIADNPESFADAVSLLLQDKPLRERLGASGRKLYEDHFTWTSAWAMLDEAGGL